MIFKGTAKHVGIGGYYMIDILFLTAAVLVSSFNTFENQSYDDIEIYEQRLEKSMKYTELPTLYRKNL